MTTKKNQAFRTKKGPSAKRCLATPEHEARRIDEKTYSKIQPSFQNKKKGPSAKRCPATPEHEARRNDEKGYGKEES
jgi:hypothetical protein